MIKNTNNTMRKNIFAILLLILTAAVNAQSLRFFSAENLLNTSITYLAQDSKGFMWIGTEYGLERFDGYNFTYYQHSKSNPLSLPENTITGIASIGKGRLLVGSSFGLASYDSYTDGFKKITFPDGASPRITVIMPYKKSYFVGTEGYGLFEYNPETTTVKQSPIAKGGFCSRLFIDRQGWIWLSDHSNIIRRINLKNTKQQQLLDCSTAGTPEWNMQDKDGTIYTVCLHGVFRYDVISNSLEPIDVDMIACKGCFFSGGFIDYRGNIYLGTVGNGIFIIKKGHDKAEPYILPSSKYDISDADVRDFFEDRDHNLWIACNQKGVFFVNNNESPFHVWNVEDCTSGSGIAFVSPAPGGNVMCMLQNELLFYDEHAQFISKSIPPTGLNVTYKDREGNYWAASGNTLYQFNPHSNTYSSVLQLTGSMTNVIADDAHGKLFISTFGKGLCIYDTHNHVSRQLSMNDLSRAAANRLRNDWIVTLYYDSHNLLWIGTTDGTDVYDPRTDRFLDAKLPSQLTKINMTAVSEMNNGNIAIGTNAGLFLYDRHSNKVYPFPGAEVMEDYAVRGVETDKEGDLWIGTTHGLWLYQNKTFTCYEQGNGALLYMFIPNEMIITDRGYIALAVNDNLVIFNPKEVKHGKKSIAELMLTKMLVSGIPVNTTVKSDEKTITTLPISESHEFYVSYMEGSVTMEFSMLDYSRAKDIVYQYRINGGSWNDVRMGSNSITVNLIRIGLYNIDVRAYCDGKYSEVQTYKVHVRPPWYLSWIAYIFYALIIMTVIAYVIYNFIRRQREKEKEDKMQFLINATHDIRSPMTLVMSPLQKLMKRTDLDGEMQHDIKIMERNALRVVALVNQILDIRKYDKQQMILTCQPTEMNKFVASACHDYDYQAEVQHITFNFNRQKSNIITYIDRVNFVKVINNLLSNAFKFTPDGGEITVACKSDSEFFKLTVTDTGTGISEENAKRIFDRFYQAGNSRGQKMAGSGIGLNLCKLIVTQHHGTIAAANRIDGKQGSVFTVLIPLGISHLKPEEIISPVSEERKPANEESPSESLPASAMKRTSTSYKILVVDDDEEMGVYISGELEEYYNFHICGDGKEALAEIHKGDYDLLVSDVMMPEMDGIELVKAIKSNPRVSHIPIILLTSKHDAETKLRGIQQGADAYMNKPFDIDELHARIDSLLANIQRLRGKFSDALQQADKVEEIEVKGYDDELMARVMKSVNAHLDDSDFDIDTLTSEAGISRAHLHRKMKEITGVSTSMFIRNQRMERAAKLIEEGKINITQIAYDVGFTTEAHFSTVFRKHFGMSPKEYRNSKK